jgi:hypothetical protein
MTDDSESTVGADEDKTKLLEVFLEMQPLVFGEPATEDDRLVSRAQHRIRSSGQEFVLYVEASEPADRGADAHSAALRGLQAGVALMFPPDDAADAEEETSEPADSTDEEREHLTFRIGPMEVSGSVASPFDVVVAIDPSLRQGEIDRWRTTGELRRGQIYVTGGRAALRSGNASSARSATGYSAAYNARSLQVVGLANSSSYTFFGRYRLT